MYGAIWNIVIVVLWLVISQKLVQYCERWWARPEKHPDATGNKKEEEERRSKIHETLQDALQKNLTQNIMVVLEVMVQWREARPPVWLALVGLLYFVSILIEFVVALTRAFKDKPAKYLEFSSFCIDLAQVFFGGLLAATNLAECPTLLAKSLFDAKNLWDEVSEREQMKREKKESDEKHERDKKERDIEIERGNKKAEKLKEDIRKQRAMIDDEKHRTDAEAKKNRKLEEKLDLVNKRIEKLKEQEKKQRIKELAEAYQDGDLARNASKIENHEESVAILFAMVDEGIASTIMGEFEVDNAVRILLEIMKKDLEKATTFFLAVNNKSEDHALSILKKIAVTSNADAGKMFSALAGRDVLAAILIALLDEELLSDLDCDEIDDETVAEVILEDEKIRLEEVARFVLRVKNHDTNRAASILTEIAYSDDDAACVILDIIAETKGVNEVASILIAMEDDDVAASLLAEYDLGKATDIVFEVQKQNVESAAYFLIALLDRNEKSAAEILDKLASSVASCNIASKIIHAIADLEGDDVAADMLVNMRADAAAMALVALEEIDLDVAASNQIASMLMCLDDEHALGIFGAFDKKWAAAIIREVEEEDPARAATFAGTRTEKQE